MRTALARKLALAITAYNYGLNGTRRAVTRSGLATSER
jgi:hypothetical protein